MTGVLLLAFLACAKAPASPPETPGAITLPPPRLEGTVSLESAIAQRRAIRQLLPRPLDHRQLGQLLWAAQGVSAPSLGLRTSPSAGALYPLVIFVALAEGVFRYEPSSHALSEHLAKDLRGKLHVAALGQSALAHAPAVFVIAAVPARTAAKYGSRADRFVAQESGHAVQNLLLQATALGLGGVPIGAFSADHVRQALGLGPDYEPYYLIPVGYPAAGG